MPTMSPDLDEESGWICSSCIGDQALVAGLVSVMHKQPCSFCDSNNPTSVSLVDLAERIDEAIRSVYRHAEDQALSSESDKVYYEQQGDDLVDILELELEVDHSAAEALAKVLEELDPADVRDGDQAFYSFEQKYVRGLANSQPFHEKWEEFERRLAHCRRFFDAEAATLLGEFLGSPSAPAPVPLAALTGGPGQEFSSFYRARLANSTAEAHRTFSEPQTELGPPPEAKCPAGRMNSAGIPVIYGALSEKTAVAEVRPPVGSIVIVGEFRLVRNVKVLDLTRLGKAVLGSIFAPDYSERAALASFLSQFHHRIARPVLPSDEVLGYLPTQAVSEYLLEVLGYDGILFASTQSGALSKGDFFDYYEGDYEFPPIDLKHCNVALSTRLISEPQVAIQYVDDSARVVRIHTAEVGYDDDYWIRVSDAEVVVDF